MSDIYNNSTVIYPGTDGQIIIKNLGKLINLTVINKKKNKKGNTKVDILLDDICREWIIRALEEAK